MILLGVNLGQPLITVDSPSGKKCGDWKTDQFPLKHGYVLSMQSMHPLDSKILYLQKNIYFPLQPQVS